MLIAPSSPSSFGMESRTLHPCMTMRAGMCARQATYSIWVRDLRSHLGPRNGEDRLSEQLPEFLLALGFGLVHFKFPQRGLPFPSALAGQAASLISYDIMQSPDLSCPHFQSLPNRVIREEPKESFSFGVFYGCSASSLLKR